MPFTDTVLQQQIEALGITEVLGAPRSPWQRAYVERIIGSIRRDCLDHVIVFDQASLRRVLGSYLDYFPANSGGAMLRSVVMLPLARGLYRDS